MGKLAGRYKIQSRLRPDDVLFVGTTSDAGASYEWHFGRLRLRIHENPILMNHVIKYGIGDLLWSFEPVDDVRETAVLKVEKETRGRKKIAET